MSSRLRRASLVPLAAVLLILSPPAAPAGAQTGSGSDPGSGQESSPPSSDEPAEKEAPQPSGPTVKLLDPGATPRAPLRFEIPVGEVQTVRTRGKLSNRQTVDGREFREEKIPALIMTLTVTPKEALDGGKVSYEVAITKSEVDPTDEDNPLYVKGMEEQQKRLVGLKVNAVFDARGFVSNSELVVPDGPSSAELAALFGGVRESIDQLSFPLPEEPVGIGAKWEVRTSSRQSGFVVDQTVLCQLDSAEGTRRTLTLVLNQSAKPQPVRLPTGAEAQLLSFRGRGRGTVTIDLAKLAPVALDMTTEVDNAIQFDQQGTRAKVESSSRAQTQILD